jgi:hypothetical protein
MVIKIGRSFKVEGFRPLWAISSQETEKTQQNSNYRGLTSIAIPRQRDIFSPSTFIASIKLPAFLRHSKFG